MNKGLNDWKISGEIEFSESAPVTLKYENTIAATNSTPPIVLFMALVDFWTSSTRPATEPITASIEGSVKKILVKHYQIFLSPVLENPNRQIFINFGRAHFKDGRFLVGSFESCFAGLRIS